MKNYQFPQEPEVVAPEVPAEAPDPYEHNDVPFPTTIDDEDGWEVDSNEWEDDDELEWDDDEETDED